MRALLVMHGPLSAEDRAAQARRLPAVLERMREDGAAITVALAGDPGGLRGDLEGVATVHLLRASLPPAPRSLAAMPRAVWGLRRVVARGVPDVVEGDQPMPAIAAAFATGPRRRCPVIYRRHHQSGGRRLLLMSRRAAQLADHVAVSSEGLLDCVVRDDGVGAERVLVVRSGTEDLRPVEASEVEDLRRRLGIASGAKVVIVLSGLRREKGLDVLLAAVGRLPAGSVEVVLAGQGPEATALRAMAARCPSEVHLVGHQDDIALWLALGELVAIPSRLEAFGRTTVEAMAAGRPMVASRVGGLARAFDDGVEGLLVAPEDPAALAAALTRVLDDPALARRMGAAGRRRFESRHTIGAMADAWRTSWETAAAGRRRP